MIPDNGTVLGAVLPLVLSLMGIGMLLSLIRLMLGPSLPDRVVALDLIGVIAVGLTAVYAVYAEQPALLDAAIAMALVAFLGTVAFARYLLRRGR
jgi:multicomponent Na+:H+ antiporter subunit F